SAIGRPNGIHPARRRNPHQEADGFCKQSSRFGHQRTGSAPGCLVIVVAHCRAHSSLASISLADSPASTSLDRTAASVNEPLIQEAIATTGPLNGAFIKESGIFRRPTSLGGSVEKMMNP